jgi:hypothetical protein
MNQQLSPRDWESLSAYLDRRLKPKEVANLEARLSADPALSAALGEMQRTRDALRGLPRLRAPRNFTLTPQMVGQRSALRARPSGRLAPVFGFASALATFILILVVVGDLLGILAPAAQPVAQAPAPTTEVLRQVAATREVEAPIANQAAPMLDQSAQPSATAEAEAQVLESPQALTETAPLSLTVGAVPPLAMAEITPTVTETETLSAKAATGMGGGGPDESGGNLLPSNSLLNAEGSMWVSTVVVAVSPTETLTFPMTVTIEGSALSETLTEGPENGWQTESFATAEPAMPAAPEESVAPLEPAPTEPVEAPEISAGLLDTPLPSQTEAQILEPTQIPPQATLAPTPNPQPARAGRNAVRILEFSLAFLALVMGSAALYIWWSRRG